MRLPRRVEVAVVGGGPAGSAAAAALAMRGRDVALFERDVFPRDKVCGEFLSPESIDQLRQLGCLDSFFERDPPSMDRVRLGVSSGSPLTVSLPGRARGLSRRALDQMLFEHASRCGARCYDGADVRRIDDDGVDAKRLHIKFGSNGSECSVTAGVVIAAYGRRTRIDRQLDRPFFERRSRWVAFKRHHRVVRDSPLPTLRGCVELHAFDGGYCGISYVEDDIVNVCTMFDRRLLEDTELDGMEFWRFVGRGDSPLARRLATLGPHPDRHTCAVAQIPLHPRRRHAADGIFFVGDSAGMIAPLAGDGQAMALESAIALAELLDGHLPRWPHRRWHWLWRRRYALRLRLGRWLNGAMVRPPIADALSGLLGLFPPATRALIRMTRG